MITRLFLTFICPCLLLASTPAPVSADDQVTVSKGAGSTLDIRISGQPFTTFNYSSTLPKPFFLPVTTAGGGVVNRALGDASDADHPHHKGIWNAIDEVNGVKFWAEKGKIVNSSTEIIRAAGHSAVIRATNAWQNPESGKAEVEETATITIHANRLLEYDMTFTAVNGPVVFEDTKEGLFGFRVAPSMKEKNGGRVTASDGSATTAKCWGRTFPWVDYSGEVGGKTVGVTIMDHPENFRPSRYHVRDYGLFSVSPFGEKAYTNGASESKPVHLEQGKTLRLRYGLYIHDGDAAAASIPAVWKQFSEASKQAAP